MPTTEVGERDDRADSGKGREEEDDGGRVGEPATEVGETEVKISKGTGGKEEGGRVLSPTTEVGDRAEGNDRGMGNEERGSAKGAVTC